MGAINQFCEDSLSGLYGLACKLYYPTYTKSTTHGATRRLHHHQWQAAATFPAKALYQLALFILGRLILAELDVSSGSFSRSVHFFQPAEFLHIVLLIQGLLHEIPAIRNISVQHFLRTRTAAIIRPTSDVHVRKCRQEPTNLVWNQA